MELLALQNAWIFRPLGSPTWLQKFHQDSTSSSGIHSMSTGAKTGGKIGKVRTTRFGREKKTQTDGSEIDVGDDITCAVFVCRFFFEV